MHRSFIKFPIASILCSFIHVQDKYSTHLSKHLKRGHGASERRGDIHGSATVNQIEELNAVAECRLKSCTNCKVDYENELPNLNLWHPQVIQNNVLNAT